MGPVVLGFVSGAAPATCTSPCKPLPTGSGLPITAQHQQKPWKRPGLLGQGSWVFKGWCNLIWKWLQLKRTHTSFQMVNPATGINKFKQSWNPTWQSNWIHSAFLGLKDCQWEVIYSCAQSKLFFLFKNPSLGGVRLQEPVLLFVFIINILILKSKAYTHTHTHTHAEGKKIAKGLVVFKEYTRYLKSYPSTANAGGSSGKYHGLPTLLRPAPFLSPTLRLRGSCASYPFCGTILGLNAF